MITDAQVPLTPSRQQLFNSLTDVWIVKNAVS